MTEETEARLVERFPRLCNQYRKQNSSFYRGFQCDDGWSELIYFCLSKIQLIADLAGLDIEIAQIKEKFAELRIYLDIKTKEGVSKEQDDLARHIIWDVVEKASLASKKICEISGEYGTLCKDGSRYKTLSYKVTREKNEYKNFNPISQSFHDLWVELDRREQNEL